MTIICSLHDASGYEHVRAGEPATMTLRMRNAGANPILISRRRGEVPHLALELGGATCDLAQAAGDFAFADGLLVPSFEERWWFPKEILSVELPRFRSDGAPGAVSIGIELDGFGAGVDGRMEAVVIRYGGTPSSLAARWTSEPRVAVARGEGTTGPGVLAMRVEGVDGTFLVALGSGNDAASGALVQPEEAPGLALHTESGRCTSASETPRAVWTIEPDAGAQAVDVTIGAILSRRPPGFAHVAVYHGDRFAILRTALVNASVSIDGFTANTYLLQNINEPATVKLSWSVVNASAVVLSTAGVVLSAQNDFPQVIEETTTFVLTAFDSALDQVVSASCTVVVDPPLVTRLVPKGTIAIWSGSADNIPPGWLLCDGTNETPDLRERFIMGAGTTRAHDKGEETQHVHAIAESSPRFNTSFDGVHQHSFPTAWYGRKLKNGDYSSIDTRHDFKNTDKVQEGGSHSHTVTINLPRINTGTNIGTVRPAWYALCYIVKGA